ncbi:hypothetical protein Taro_047323 [Colocasia esculenta]|uniref:Uncharacterized protein n=1 Tax=Colocasia esculenta TaxID=4460 RepID=A0A843WV14_COLES|nr:hypothetical protein [Colocasia esculenta]
MLSWQPKFVLIYGGRSSWRLGEQEIAHTKPFFFPVASTTTYTDSHLEVDQSFIRTCISLWTLVSASSPADRWIFRVLADDTDLSLAMMGSPDDLVDSPVDLVD